MHPAWMNLHVSLDIALADTYTFAASDASNCIAILPMFFQGLQQIIAVPASYVLQTFRHHLNKVGLLNLMLPRQEALTKKH